MHTFPITKTWYNIPKPQPQTVDSLGTVGLISSLVGVIGSFASTYYATKERTEARRFAAYMNAKIADRNADIAKKKADYQEFIKRKQTFRLLSRQRALFGKANIEISGTAAEVMERTAILEEMDAQAIKLGGIYDVQNERMEASLSRMNMRAYGRAATTTMVASALTTITKAGEAIAEYQLRKKGA